MTGRNGCLDITGKIFACYFDKRNGEKSLNENLIAKKDDKILLYNKI